MSTRSGVRSMAELLPAAFDATDLVAADLGATDLVATDPGVTDPGAP